MSTTHREQVLIIAAKAAADPRTVERLLRGEQVRGTVRERIEIAARELGTTPHPQAQGGDVRTVRTSSAEIRDRRAVRTSTEPNQAA